MRLKAAIAAVPAVGVLLLATGLTASAQDNTNDASYWNDQFPHAAVCFRHDLGDDGGHGRFTNDGESYELVPFDPTWFGDHWEALIINADGTDRVIRHPDAGTDYFASEVDGDRPVIDHVIVCKGESESEPEPTPEPTPEPEPTPDATEMPGPTPDATRRPGRTPRPTEVPAPTIRPNLDLPPTDTAGDFGATSGGQGGDQSGLLLGMAILAGTGAAFIVLSLRHGASAKR